MKRIKRKGDGYAIKLPEEERELLASLPGNWSSCSTRRRAMPDHVERPGDRAFFPDAYSAADTDLADEYRRLMTDDLRERTRAALENAGRGRVPSASTKASCTRG